MNYDTFRDILMNQAVQMLETGGVVNTGEDFLNDARVKMFKIRIVGFDNGPNPERLIVLKIIEILGHLGCSNHRRTPTMISGTFDNILECGRAVAFFHGRKIMEAQLSALQLECFADEPDSDFSDMENSDEDEFFN